MSESPLVGVVPVVDWASVEVGESESGDIEP